MRSDLFTLILTSSGKRPPRDDPGSAQGGAEERKLFATRILIVEDEVMIAWMVESVLEDAGFTDIAIAANHDRACALATEAMPGLIVSDINLGDGPDGIATAAAIRRAGAMPVLFVTAYSDEATRSRIVEQVPGAVLLRKPVQAQALCQAVMDALRTRKAH